MSIADEAAVASICQRLRESDAAEVDALFPQGSRYLWSLAPSAYPFARFRAIFRHVHVPAAFFMAEQETATTLRVSMLATEDWPHVARAACRWWLKTFKAEAFAAGFKRAECRVHARNTKAVDLLSRLGFVIEGEVPCYSWSGEPFIQMAWVQDHVPVQNPKDSSAALAPDAGGRARRQ